MTLIVPVGPPGSGKSHLAQTLLENGTITRDAIVSPDEYRRILTGDRRNQSKNAAVFEVCDLIATSRAHSNLNVYYDATNYQRLSFFQNLALTTEVPLVIVRFTLPEPVLILRNETRADPVPLGYLHEAIRQFYAIPIDHYPVEPITPDEAVRLSKKRALL